MSQLGQGQGVRRSGINWNAIGVLLTALALIYGFAAGVFGDYRKIGDRVNALETQRVEDLRRLEQQRTDDTRWRERMENKMDQLIQRKQ